MSLTNTIVRQLYNANGSQTTFAIPYTDIESDSSETFVYIRDESTSPAVEIYQIEGSDYSLTGANPPTIPFDTDVEFDVAPASGLKVLVIRQLLLRQSIDVIDNTEILPATTIETGFDRSIALVQQMQEQIDRTLKMMVTTSHSEKVLDEPNALLYLRWKSDSSGVESVTPGASEISFTPSGNLSSTNVQDAIDEVEDQISAIEASATPTEEIQDAIGTILLDTTDIDLTYNDATPSISADLTTSGVTSGTYGSSTQVGQFAVNSKGRITSASNVAITASAISGFDEAAQDAVGSAFDTSLTYNDGTNTMSRAALTGDITTSLGSNATILATVNSNVGSFGTATQASSITVNGKGLVTAASNTSINIPSTQVSDFTEASQDSIGAMVDSTLVYVDATPLLTRAALTGDITAPQASNATTLATVNANVGSFGSATQAPQITINAKGLVTAASNTTIAVTSSAITDFTEAAQDSTGAMVGASLVYVDATPLLARAALTGDVTATQNSNATTIANDAVTFAKMQNITTDRLIGRDTAATGDIEEISVSGGLEFTGSTGIQRSALTGDITASAGSNATTLATVNSNIGTFGSATQVSSVTVNAKGLTTAASNITISIPSTQVSDFVEAAQDAVGNILVDGTTVNFTYSDSTPNITAEVIMSAIDHGSLAGLLDDDHPQYALLAGRTGGQVLIGGTNSSDDLTLQSTSNVTKGDIFISDGVSNHHRMPVAAGASVVFNDTGIDMDFRVEGDTLGSLLFVDASADFVGIGTSSPAWQFHVDRNQNASTVMTVSNTNSVGTSAAAALRMESDSASFNYISHGTADTTSRWGVTLGGYGEMLLTAGNAYIIGTISASQPLIQGTNSIERFRLTDTSAVFNEPGNDVDLRIEGDTETNLLFIDASTDRIGIGTSTPAKLLDISSTAPAIRMTDTTASAKSLIIETDGNKTNFYEAAGAAGDILSLDLANKRVGIGVSSPSRVFQVKNNLEGFSWLDSSGTERLRFSRDATGGQFYDSFEAENWYRTISGDWPLIFAINSLEKLRLKSTEAVFNNTGADYDFRIGGDTITNLFFLDASQDSIGIGTSSFGTSALKVISLGNGTAPSTSPADIIQIWAQDTVAGQSNLYARNENGKSEQLTGLADRVSTQFDTTSTTLANITGLSHNVEAGKAYTFEAILYTTSNIAGGVKAAIAGTATATSIIYEGVAFSAAALAAEGRTTTLGTAVAGVTAVTAAYIRITGTIVVNAAGTLTVQFAANAAVGTSSVLVGSSWVLKPIGD